MRRIQQRSEETRAHILESAGILFARFGYEASGVAEICKTAGVSKGAFYHHFPSKHAVFMSLLDIWLAGLDRELGEALQLAGNVPDGLINIAGKVSWIFESADKSLPMFLEFWTHAARDPVVWETTVAPYLRYQHLFSEIIQRGISENSFKSADTEKTSKVVLALALGLVLQGVLDRDKENLSEVAQYGMRLMMDGLKAQTRDTA